MADNKIIQRVIKAGDHSATLNSNEWAAVIGSLTQEYYFFADERSPGFNPDAAAIHLALLTKLSDQISEPAIRVVGGTDAANTN